MKTNEPDDARLRAVLREWQPAAGLPPRFQERVWQRIERAEAAPAPASGAALRRWVSTWFRRPALVVAYLAVVVSAGLSAGYWHGRKDAAQERSELESRYLQAVDPFRH